MGQNGNRMEQDEVLYEYKMAHEVYRFEAHSHEEAEKVRQYAILHFAEKLGRAFDEEALIGPERVSPLNELGSIRPTMTDPSGTASQLS